MTAAALHFDHYQKYKVLYKVPAGEPIHDIMRETMPDNLELVTLESNEKAELYSKLGEADFVIAINLDAEMISAAPKLKLIQLAGVGFDGIDIPAATRAGIPVAQTVEGTIIGVAEHTILLILALYKRLLEADTSLRRGEWLVWQLRPTSYTLSGKMVGIIGLGKIGREVARRCQAFGARVCYHDVNSSEGGTLFQSNFCNTTEPTADQFCDELAEQKNARSAPRSFLFVTGQFKTLRSG